MFNNKNAKFKFFGIDLDPTDDPVRIKFKHALAKRIILHPWQFRNPYEALTSHLKKLFDSGNCEKLEEIHVPSWLTPAPYIQDLPLVTAEKNNRFVDENGCYEYAELVRRFTEEKINKQEVPLMISVDHSMTGGLLRALSERYGPAAITVFIIDSHLDAISFSHRMALFEYTKGKYPHNPNPDGSSDSILKCWEGLNFQETYNCANWLKYLIEEGTIFPENIWVFGVSDYPTKEMYKLPKIRPYVDEYHRLERKGVTIMPKVEMIDKIGVNRLIEEFFEKMTTNHIYISLDVDIGALNAVFAARFMNVVGITRTQFNELGTALRKGLSDGKQLIGADVTGIETFLLGQHFPNGKVDKTLETVSAFIKRLIGREPEFVHQQFKDIPKFR